MKVRIEIDTKTFVRFWLVVIGFVLAGFAIFSARDALMIVGVSLFLALALNIPVSQISKRLPGKSRIGATAISYVAVITLLSAVIFLVVPPIVQQTAKFVQTLPEFVETTTTQWDGLKVFIDSYGLQPQVDQALESLQESTSSWASNVGQAVISGVGSVLTFIASAFLVIVLTFLMLIEGPRWMNRLWSMYRDQAKLEKHKSLASRVYNVVTGYITGQLTVSSIGAVTAGLSVFVLSFIFPEIPANLAMPTAAITFLLSLIPMFGATIGGILITVLLMFNSIPAAIIYAVFFIVYQQIENNFISPHIQAKKIDLSALAVLVAITIGLYMFGIIGGVIAIPIAGTIRVFFDEYFVNPRRQTKTSSDSGAKKFLKLIKEKKS
jgi:predicted PurR-regulated permease PerM